MLDHGTFACRHPRCLTCRQTTSQTLLLSPKRLYTIRDRFTCQSVNVVYSIICRRCGSLYIGETGRRRRERFCEHLRSIGNNSPGFPVAEHFKSASHSLNDIIVCGLKRCSGDNTRRKKQEMRLIFELGTLSQMALTLTLVSFKPVHCFYLMRTHLTHTLGLGHTFLFHSCVSRARTLHASALSPLIFSYGVCQVATMGFFTLMKGSARNVCTFFNVQ